MDLKKTQKIGILGGTFDPVHEGHLAVARTVLARCNLDLVLFVPALAPPHKERRLTPFGHRVAMLEAAVGDDPCLAVSPLEAERPAPSYTVDTLRELHRRLGPRQFFLIIGADMFAEIRLWYRYSELFRLARLIVVARPGFPLDDMAARVAALPGKFTHDPARQLWLRADGFCIFYLPDVAIQVSSSQVRSLLAQGKPVAGLLPAPVREYIWQHGLYGSTDQGLNIR
jgi:nicotinate-nucleotide adenylyltransferase